MTEYYECPDCEVGTVEVTVELGDDDEVDCDTCPFYTTAGNARVHLVEVDD